MLTSVAGFVLFSAGTGGMKMADRLRFCVGGECFVVLVGVFSGLMSCEMGLGTSVWCGLGVVEVGAGDEGVVGGGGVELVDEAVEGFVGSFGVLGTELVVVDELD
uniref:(northern house mosquito) hypothetical protein n=1 Tax=Culex pipiens TaxID=7175 RepID=A0A8D8N7I9_CULPI